MELESEKMKPPSPLEKLSEREKTVFLLLGNGKTTSEIAKILRLSLKTVQSFCAREMNSSPLVVTPDKKNSGHTCP
jgi:DNA-binding NarL/FixJ family response regulator